MGFDGAKHKHAPFQVWYHHTAHSANKHTNTYNHVRTDAIPTTYAHPFVYWYDKIVLCVLMCERGRESVCVCVPS